MSRGQGHAESKESGPQGKRRGVSRVGESKSAENPCQTTGDVKTARKANGLFQLHSEKGRDPVTTRRCTSSLYLSDRLTGARLFLMSQKTEPWEGTAQGKHRRESQKPHPGSRAAAPHHPCGWSVNFWGCIAGSSAETTGPLPIQTFRPLAPESRLPRERQAGS